MASYASCRANSFSFAIYHSCAYWPGYFSPGIVSSGKSAVTFFLAEEKIPGSYLYSLNEFFNGHGDVPRRVQRINSWDIVVDIPKVIGASLSIFNSLELILFVLFFVVFANVYYFVCRKSFQLY